MKISLIFQIFAFALTATSAWSAPSASEGGKTTPSPVKKDSPAVESAPISNYWDANEWEAGSGSTFWHKTSSNTKLSPSPSSPDKQERPRATPTPRKNTKRTDDRKD